MPTAPWRSRAVAPFLALVFGFSLPFWVIGAAGQHLARRQPINLPLSALMFICPLAAALILTYRAGGAAAAKHLFRRALDYQRIPSLHWYAPILLLMPTVMLVSYGLMRLAGRALPDPVLPWAALPILFGVFAISAASEELGWSGYLTGPLQQRWGALGAGFAIGVVWAFWHVLPWFQGDHNAAWVAWQCVTTVVLRVLIVWLFNNTSRSVFAATLFHAMINVSTYAFPNYGSGYDPTTTCVVLTAATVVIVWMWGPQGWRTR